jgi:hypothetical protein
MRSGAAELHTDAAYRADPEALVALFCVRPARDGGLSILLTVDDLMFGLPDDLESELRRPTWRWRPPEVFGGDVTPPHPVLSSGGTVRWRYDTLVPTAQQSASAQAFRDHLAGHPGIQRMALPTDSVLFVDNRRVLHGRTAFSDPDRLLLRVRLRSDARSR